MLEAVGVSGSVMGENTGMKIGMTSGNLKTGMNLLDVVTSANVVGGKNGGKNEGVTGRSVLERTFGLGVGVVIAVEEFQKKLCSGNSRGI
jgi:hypothetical protein